MLSTPTQPIPFRTFPDPRIPTGNHFRFVVSSCVTPNFPYTPFRGRTIKGFDLLAEYLWPSKKEAAQDSAALSKIIAGDEVLEHEREFESLNIENGGPASSDAVSSDVPSAPSNTGSGNGTTLSEPQAVVGADFMLFLGDFIYADVPIWWGDGEYKFGRLHLRLVQLFYSDKETYRRFYRRNYNSPSFRKIYEKLRE
jgi:alkaline phosphatase D